MNVIDTLITDRTSVDVVYALQLDAAGWANMTSDQQAQWAAGMKGTYNATDLNRVTEAVNYIASEFQNLGYSIAIQPINIEHFDGTISTVWQGGENPDYPTAGQMQTYLENVQALMNVVYLAQTTPSLPESMAFLTYVEANNIEQILQSIYEAIRSIRASFLYSAQPLLYSGFAIYTASKRLRLYDVLLRALNTSDGKALYVR